jgi:hypothetical protein
MKSLAVLLSTAALAFPLALPLTAQVEVSVQPLNAAGVVLVDGANNRLTQSFPANKDITTKSTIEVKTQGTSNPYYVDYVQTVVQPPQKFGKFYESRMSIFSKSAATKGTSTKGLHTSDKTGGNVAAQKYRVTLKSTAPHKVTLDMWGSGNNYGNAAASIQMTVGKTNRTWTYNKISGYSTERIKVPMTVNGTVTVDLTIQGSVSPGTGGGKNYDGYETRFSLTVVPNNIGSFTHFGKSCSTATLSAAAAPITGHQFAMDIKGAPASASHGFFLIGTSKTFLPFLNIKLPLALDGLGAKGCSLYVSHQFPILGAPKTGGGWSMKVFLNPWFSSTWYIQGMVLDAKANTAGFSMTQAAELKF